jgi:hypothetical protein
VRLLHQLCEPCDQEAKVLGIAPAYVAIHVAKQPLPASGLWLDCEAKIGVVDTLWGTFGLGMETDTTVLPAILPLQPNWEDRRIALFPSLVKPKVEPVAEPGPQAVAIVELDVTIARLVQVTDAVSDAYDGPRLVDLPQLCLELLPGNVHARRLGLGGQSVSRIGSKLLVEQRIQDSA